MSDVLFLSSVKDRVLSSAELRMLAIASKVVWFGLGLLVVSGFLLFLLSPETYSTSTKFLAKMTIVGVIIVNGIIFHFKHLPLIKASENQPLFSSEEFKKGSSLLVVSGALSVVSWSFALILGVLGDVPYSYFAIMLTYSIVVLFTALTAFFVERKLVKTARLDT